MTDTTNANVTKKKREYTEQQKLLLDGYMQKSFTELAAMADELSAQEATLAEQRHFVGIALGKKSRKRP